MKKVFLYNFSTPIMRDVALELQKRGVEIVYWQGYRSDFKNFSKDRKNFSNVIFNDHNNAARVILPDKLQTVNLEPVGESSIKKLCEYESQALAMMGRSDLLTSSFAKKRSVYYKYIKYWYAILKTLQPDAILFVNVPHGASTFVLYSLAKALRIKTIMLDHLTIDSRSLLMNDYTQGSLALTKELEASRNKKYNVDDLSHDLRDCYIKQRDPAEDSTPHYVRRIPHEKTFLPIPSVSTIVKHIVHLTIFKATFRYLEMLFSKTGPGVFHEKIFGITFKWKMHRRNQLNKKIFREYISLQLKPDLSKNFIYIPLHKQPENNTCPMGGVFDDQFLMIDIIASSIPDHWAVYVKESNAQWSKGNIAGHLYRYEGYYREIAKLKNTHLIPTEISTYELIKNAQAIATITGTAGWEAVLRDKHALVFGYAWYKDCEGVFRVSDFQSCRAAIKKIMEGHKPDQQKVINFLAALDRVSIKAKDYRNYIYKEDKYVSRKDNVENISKAFYQAIIN